MCGVLGILRLDDGRVEHDDLAAMAAI